MMKFAIVSVVLVGFFAGSVARAGEPDSRGFSVDFPQCTEFAGVGPVDFSSASTLVQPAFTTLPAGTGSTAAIVVRATSCASAQVDGRSPSQPVPLMAQSPMLQFVRAKTAG